MIRKLLSWAFLFVAFFCWIYTLMWVYMLSEEVGSFYVIASFLWGVLSTFFTTLLSPRSAVYDLVRYFMLFCLAWIAYHVNVWVMLAIIGVALLLLPSVITDFKGEGTARQDKIIQAAFSGYVKKQSDGIMFERQCAEYLRKMGYSNVRMTKTTGDFGADLTAYDRYGHKWVFQCKRYSGGVGVAAVQQAVAAKAHYGATRGGVMTNSHMTEAAKQLAWENAIEIIEGLSD